jgi:hypothetical protein
MSMRRPSGILVVLLAASTALLTAGCGAAGSSGTRSGDAGGANSWQAVPAGPLSPREGALGLWTGEEVLLIGGSDARPCPPNASCVPPDVPPLADGAAFDPQTGGWRRIADAPVPFEWAQGLVVGETAYLWAPGSSGRPNAPSAFLAYRIDEDRWEELPPPPGDLGWLHGIVQAGERIVAYGGSDEQGEQPDFVFDPATSSWSELPPDPLSPSFDRSMAWSGRELLLFEHELVSNPGSERPAVTRAAALDLESGAWRRLPDSEILATGPWVPDEGRLINPTLGGADGGEVNNWGRAYPYGGILDLERGTWSPLPSPPDEEENFSSGVLTESGGHYFGYRGWILDSSDDAWIEIPPLDTDALVTGRTVVAAGPDLLVFGGARWKEGNGDGTLLADAWVWSPRGSSSDSSSAQSSAPSASESSERSVAVLELVGMSEGEAVKALGASGLVANVRYAEDAPRTGKVLRSDPQARSEVPPSSVVVLSIAYEPRLPMPTPEQEQLPEAFSSILEDNPEVFFGSYRDEEGVSVVVFNPGVDPADWEDRLTAAATGINYPEEDSGYRTGTCSRDRTSLRTLQDEIVRTRKDWAHDPGLAFAVWVQPETCTVRVESDLLTPGDIQALVDRHGTAISFDTSEGAAPVLLPLID